MVDFIETLCHKYNTISWNKRILFNKVSIIDKRQCLINNFKVMLLTLDLPDVKL